MCRSGDGARRVLTFLSEDCLFAEPVVNLVVRYPDITVDFCNVWLEGFWLGMVLVEDC